MNRRHLHRLGTGLLIAFDLTPPPALAASPPGQEAATPGAQILEKVTVVGIRHSLATAQEVKREKLEIVDSVVADDIAKLPDFSVTDALQRITGVQVARDRGEGTARWRSAASLRWRPS